MARLSSKRVAAQRANLVCTAEIARLGLSASPTIALQAARAVVAVPAATLRDPDPRWAALVKVARAAQIAKAVLRVFSRAASRVATQKEAQPVALRCRDLVSAVKIAKRIATATKV
jgi:hypothetical protein